MLLNRINPNKLHHSKWTASQPRDKEKHFMVVQLVRDDDDVVTHVILEAVLSRRQYPMPWRDLQDGQQWLMGWG